MIILNIICFLTYFVFWTLIFWLIYYLGWLPNYVPFRYKFNLLDFYLDCLKISSFDVKSFDPDTFTKSGIVVYEGMQGSGKTISMVHDVLILRKEFPKAVIFDNLNQKFHDQELSHPSQLCEFNNGHLGCICEIDELAIWFSNRDYRHFAESGMLQVIFENRKVRRYLVGTTQKFMLIDKNIRIQTSEVRSCFTVGGFLTGYVRKRPVVDSEGNILRYKFRGFKVFVQSHELREAYDTYHVIKKFNDNGFKSLS